MIAYFTTLIITMNNYNKLVFCGLFGAYIEIECGMGFGRYIRSEDPWEAEGHIIYWDNTALGGRTLWVEIWVINFYFAWSEFLLWLVI